MVFILNYLLTKQVDSGKLSIAIFLDLTKDFDTINHTLLLSKLIHYGICGVENEFLWSYLSNPYQVTVYNGFQSVAKLTVFLKALF